MTENQPAIHVIDDDASFRKAVGRMLQTCGYQVALYESGKQYLQGLPQSEPGCILLDLKMSPMSGLELQEQLSRMGRYSPIIFLTGHGDIPASVQAIKSGADNFLTKPVSKATLITAVESAFLHFAKARAERDRLANLNNLVTRLTPREREVFDLIVRGKLNKEIAHDLGRSERTIKVRRYNIMHKLEVQSFAELVLFAGRLGMLPTHDDEEAPANRG